MLCIVSALGMRAQTWTAPEILGSDPVSGNVYKVKNVESGLFLTGAATWYSWATSTALTSSDKSLSFTLTQTAQGWTLQRTSDNKYTFISGSYYGKGEMHVDMGSQGHQYFEFIKQSNGYYHIRAVASDADYGATMEGYDDKCWGWDGSSNNAVYATVTSTDGFYCDWQFIDMGSAYQLYDARVALYNVYLKAVAEGADTDDAATVYNNSSATVEELNDAKDALNATRYAHALAVASNDDPREITDFILKNPDFSAGNIDGWETNYVSGQQAQNIGYQGASYSNGDITISQFIETWKPGATIGDGYLRQTVSGLPEGKFVLEADGISSWQSDASVTVTGSQLFITADGIDYTTDMATANGKPEHFSTQFLNLGEGDVIFGLRTVNSTGNWLCADNFKVTYYGIDHEPYKELLAEAVAAAEAVKGTVPDAVYAPVQEAVTANNKVWATAKEYVLAIAAIQAATNTAKPIQTAYARYTSMKAQILADSPGTSTSTADNQVALATTPEEIDAAIITLRKAFLEELPYARISEKTGYISLTNFIIENPTPTSNSDGWTVTDAEGNEPEEYLGKFDSGNNNAEFWSHGGYSLKQTLWAALPKGYYRLTAVAVTRDGMQGVLSANDNTMNIVTEPSSVLNNLGQCKTYFDAGNGVNELIFKLDKAEYVTIGLTADNTTGDHWTVWRSFALDYLGADPMKVYIAKLNNAIEEAKKSLAEMAIPAAAAQEVTKLIDGYTAAMKNYTTTTEYTNAAAEVEKAVSDVTVLVAPLAHYNEVKATVKAVYSGIDLTAADAAANAATTVEALNAATAKAYEAFATYLNSFEEKTIDLTNALIKNPSPGTSGKTDYWINSTSPGLEHELWEFWSQSGATTKQNIEAELPAGFYKLTAIAFTRDGMEAKLNAGPNTMNIETVAKDIVNNREEGDIWITIGHCVNELSFRLKEPTANLEIGLTADNTTGDHWMCWRSFKLEYLGTAPLALTKDELKKAIAIAKATAEELDVPTGVKNNLTSEAGKYEAAMSGYATSSEYKTALDAVEGAVKDAENAAASVAKNADILEKAKATVALEALSESAKTALQSAIDGNAATLAACKTDAEIVAQNKALWAAVGKAIGESAEGKRFDLTYLLTNPGFETGNLNGWTNSGSINAQAQSNSAFDGKQDGYYAERWHVNGTVDLNQTLTDMPAGYYQISANLYTDTPDGKFYANGVSTAFSKSGRYTVLVQLAEAGDLKIGAGCTLTNSTWICMDAFTVDYLGEDLMWIYRDKVQAAIDEARDAKLEVPAGILNDLTSLLNGYETAKDGYTTVEECDEAVAAIKVAVEDAKKAEAPAAENAKIQEKATLTAALSKLSNENVEKLRKAMAENTAALNACKTAAEIKALNDALWTAVFAAIESIELTGNEVVDLTYLLTNPDLTGMNNGKKEGWYTDQNEPIQNSQAMTTNNAVANTADPSKYAMYEYWSCNSEATEGFTVYQKVTLPAGTYKMEALCVAAYGGGARYTTPETKNITFSANDINGTKIMTATLEPASLDFIQSETGEVKIGLKAHEGNTSNWMGIGYVQFYKVAAKTIEISENVDYTPASAAGDVKVTRTIKAGTWNTLVLPFQVKNEELKAAFGDDVEVAEESEVASETGSTINFTKMETPALAPNKPVLLKTAKAGTEYTFKNRTVAAGEPVVAGTNFDFLGTYAASTTVAAGDYFLSADKIFQSEGKTTVKGTHAYLKAKAGTDAAEVKVEFFIDGVATAIESIDADTDVQNGTVYNLAGQRVQKAQRGLYIVNGKKVVIK